MTPELWISILAVFGVIANIMYTITRTGTRRIDASTESIELKTQREKLDTQQAVFAQQQTEARVGQLDRDLRDEKERAMRTSIERVAVDADYKAQILALNTSLIAVQSALSLANVKIDQLTGQNAMLQAALDTASAKIDQQMTEIMGLRELLQSQNGEIRTLVEQKAALSGQAIANEIPKEPLQVNLVIGAPAAQVIAGAITEPKAEAQSAPVIGDVK